jgi:AraC-like DNA-binding protein
VSVAQVAADLGYADQAHLAADFRTVLGLTPSAYRADAGPEVRRP